jgi:hypothetical protein
VRRGGASQVKLSRVVLGSAVAVSLVGGGLMSMPAAAQDECGVSIYGGDVLNETVIDLNANGGTARLVMLPHERHNYAARESVLHVVAEMIDWLDRWVKPERTPGENP